MSGKKNDYITLKQVLTEFVTTLIGFFVVCWLLFAIVIYFSVWHAAAELPVINQQEYLRVRIYGSSSSPDGNTISAAFSIVDTNGNEITAIERSWAGNYLGVEFAEVKIHDLYFLFPSKIYGKERIMETKPQRNKSTNLEKYYDENEQCMLYGFGSTYAERNNLYKIARFATGKYPVPAFGYITDYSLDLSSCKINTWYSIQRTADGNLVIVEY